MARAVLCTATMRPTVLLLTLVFVLAACGDVKDHAGRGADAGSDDHGGGGAQVDAGTGPDASPPPEAPTSVTQTAGGGRATSPSYILDLRIGAPQPAGVASGAAGTVRVAPKTTF